jgi:acetylornithine deacetylase/succinyl-diaminopimelate desuccinylase-like protein
MRLVPDQEPAVIAGLVASHLRNICPDYADIEISAPAVSARPVIFDVENPWIKAGRKALARGFGAEPVFTRCGGSIPVVETLHEQLGVPIVLMGFGLDSDGAHSPNEQFSLENFRNGIRTSACLLAGAASIG